MTQVDDVIEQYKSELLAEAELARGDVQEIEDHLRRLTEELRERGIPAADAVRVACERLGDPRVIAREHARVRSPFGARLSRARSISAALLMLVPVIHFFDPVAYHHRMQVACVANDMVTILGTVMVFALLARLTWARPIVLGAVGFFALKVLKYELLDFMEGSLALWALIPSVGTVMFVMPWRRGELQRAGYALALQAYAFAAGAEVARLFVISTPLAPAALIGAGVLAIAVCGTVLRARWAALASAVGAITLVVALVELTPFFFRYNVSDRIWDWIPFAGMLVTAAIAASIAAIASWRSARTTIGTLQYVLR